MTSMDIAARHAAAEAVAREAADHVRRRFRDRSSFTLGFKGHQDYITEVDGEVERLIVERLARSFPRDGFLGEEGGARGASEPEGLWVVDPIDGTANFARGIPHFCVSIALVEAGAVVAGIIVDPMMDEVFSARRGAGALLNGAPMRVSDTSDMTRATIEIGWNLRRGGIPAFMGIVERVTSTGAGMLRAGSGALGLAYVAAGRTDGYCEEHINSWDCLAGVLLVAEAGGRVNDFLAGDGLLSGGPIIAAAPGVAGAFSAAAGIGFGPGR